MRAVILGAPQVIASIAAVREYALKTTEEELEAAAEFGSDVVRAVAPIDTGAYRYGGTSASGTRVVNKIAHAKQGEFSWAWGTPAPYGRALELGHPITGAPAQPHFEPSMQLVADFFLAGMTERGFRRS